MKNNTCIWVTSIYIYILSYNSVKNYKQENIKLTERNQVDSLK
jgi:hypothetical protein